MALQRRVTGTRTRFAASHVDPSNQCWGSPFVALSARSSGTIDTAPQSQSTMVIGDYKLQAGKRGSNRKRCCDGTDFIGRFPPRFAPRLARSLGGPIAIYKRAVLIVALVSLPALGHGEPTKARAAETVSPKTAITLSRLDASKLESEKFEYQKALEEKKLGVEQLKAWLTGGSILIPLVLGILTLAWQSRTATKLKEREASGCF